MLMQNLKFTQPLELIQFSTSYYIAKHLKITLKLAILCLQQIMMLAMDVVSEMLEILNQLMQLMTQYFC
jgi:SUMO ligase MMS21 Smc5/6 complex component